MTRLNFSKIGGTDVSKILGCNPWSGPIDVFNRIVNGVQYELPEASRERADWGNRLEETVAQAWYEWAQEDPAAWAEGESIEPEELPWVRYTVDRQRRGALLEVKTTSVYAAGGWGPTGSDEIPMHYAMQVHWYLYHECRRKAACGEEPPTVCYVAVLIGGQEMRCYAIEVDAKLEQDLFDRVEAWRAAHILTKIAPDVDGSQSYRDYLDQKWKDERASIRVASGAEMLEFTGLAYLKEKKAKLDDAISEHENRLREMIGEDGGLEAIIDGRKHKATYKTPPPSTRVDWKKARPRLAERIDDLDALLEPYTKETTPSRRLTVRISKQ